MSNCSFISCHKQVTSLVTWAIVHLYHAINKLPPLLHEQLFIYIMPQTSYLPCYMSNCSFISCHKQVTSLVTWAIVHLYHATNKLPPLLHEQLFIYIMPQTSYLPCFMSNFSFIQGQKLTVAHSPMATETSAGRLNNTSKEPSWRLIILYFLVASLTFEASC
jgi:hypothetical protein